MSFLPRNEMKKKVKFEVKHLNFIQNLSGLIY